MVFLWLSPSLLNNIYFIYLKEWACFPPPYTLSRIFSWNSELMFSCCHCGSKKRIDMAKSLVKILEVDFNLLVQSLRQSGGSHRLCACVRFYTKWQTSFEKLATLLHKKNIDFLFQTSKSGKLSLWTFSLKGRNGWPLAALEHCFWKQMFRRRVNRAEATYWITHSLAILLINSNCFVFYSAAAYIVYVYSTSGIKYLGATKRNNGLNTHKWTQKHHAELRASSPGI